MRYSSTQALPVLRPAPEGADNLTFLRAVAAQTTADERRCSLLLVGGSSVGAVALRQAQARLRYDRMPSYWSHAALLLRWEDTVEAAVGAEVSLWPQEPPQQAPVRNGVTLFSLARYLSVQEHPNLAVLTLRFRAAQPAAADAAPVDPKDSILQAALRPNQERTRFPLWDELAPWAGYVYAPEQALSPLTQGRPMPAAAFCEYAFEAGGVDLAAGATSAATCPETLWATARHWHDRLDRLEITVQAFALIRDPGGVARCDPAADLEQALAAWPR